LQFQTGFLSFTILGNQLRLRLRPKNEKKPDWTGLLNAIPIKSLQAKKSRYHPERHVTCKIHGGQWRYACNSQWHLLFLLLTFLKDLEVGNRIKVAELRQLITDDPAYQNLTTEEEDQMKQDALEFREQKKVGARPTNKSAAQDYRAQLTRMNNEARF
jgi:hypothetical protein